jgi:pSer/pThr/pTyr-binding forkhead associated (FHA) protein
VSKQSPELFREACGCRDGFHLNVAHRANPGGNLRTFHLPFAVLGRSADTDLTLDHEQVSGHHAYVQMIQGRLWCVDMRSRTGTHWVRGPATAGWLEKDQPVRIGPFAISLTDYPSLAAEFSGIADPLHVRVSASELLPGLALEFVNGISRRPVWHLHHVLTLLGGSSLCQVRLTGPSVSRLHCSLLRTARGVWVIDLLGREVVLVNGEPVRWALLEDGDELQVGHYRIRVRCDNSYHASEDPGPRTYEAAVLESLGNHVPSPNLPSPPVTNHSATTSPLAAESVTLPDGTLFPMPMLKLEPPTGGALVAANGQALIGGSPVEAVMLHLVNQFSAMQQHMFDQFQQSTLMMVQMFSALHRDQLGLIRTELDRLHELTHEMQVLQQEMIKHSGRSEAAPKTNGAGANGGAHHPAPNVTSSPSFTRPGQQVPTTAGNASNGQSANQSDRDVHAWLCERFAALQQERQTRWQKILSFLTGKSVPVEEKD